MKLYVIRHGQTDCNKEHKYNGKYDEDINEAGINQVKEARDEVKKLNIDLVICSPLKRTRHTLELLDLNAIPVIYDDRLEERDCGVFTNQPINDYYFNEYYNYYSTEYIEGMETLPDLFKRVHGFLDEIKQKYKNKNILIVTSGAIARTIQFYFQELPEDGMIKDISVQKNCEIKEYEIKEGSL